MSRAYTFHESCPDPNLCRCNASPIPVTIMKDWWVVTTNYPPGMEQLCVDYVIKNWRYDSVEPNRDGYTTIYKDRFPQRSRNYNDNGVYIEVIGFANVPLAVASWNWGHCSCNQWDDNLKLPESVIRFSSYCQLRSHQYSVDPLYYLRERPIQDVYECERKDDDDPMFIYRKVIERVYKLLQ